MAGRNRSILFRATDGQNRPPDVAQEHANGSAQAGRAKAALGTGTETNAVDPALDLVVLRTGVFRAEDQLMAVGDLASVESIRDVG
jgi:hypothetical protein